MLLHRAQRAALADALAAAGPGAPTLCEGWRAEHLAAHVVLRETAPLAAAGIVVAPLAGRTERATQDLGDRSSTPSGYADLVARVRQGPHRLNPMAWSDAAQLVELFVHTEDVRRGGADGWSVPARELDEVTRAGLWTGVRRMAGMLYRRSPVRVALSATDGPSGASPWVLRAGPSGAATVVVTGPVGELLLHGYDRSRVAHVEVEGAAEDVAALDRYRPRG